jgi:hypothetical protein
MVLFEPTVPGRRGREPLLHKHLSIGHDLRIGLNVSADSALFGRPMAPVVSLRADGRHSYDLEYTK